MQPVPAVKKSLVDAGDLSRRTWSDYYTACEELIEAFGKERPVADLAGPDFEKLRASFAKQLGPVALGVEIQRVRTVWKFANDKGLLIAPGRQFARSVPKRRRLLLKVFVM